MLRWTGDAKQRLDPKDSNHQGKVFAMRLNPSCGWIVLAALGSTLGLAGCSDLKPNPTPPNYQGLGSGSPGDLGSAGRVGGDDSGSLFAFGKNTRNNQGQAGGGSGIGVNAFLWRGALDTISFMPLASADPFGGVIITDWYTPPGTTGERFKATIYILSRDLRSDGLRVNLYRQVMQNGQWVDATVSDQTVGDIENKVLDRARRMREQMQASN
ncbi:MAG TPA: DUF3576 domain-containing protein [Rhodopila sp.]|uniref:DUF3576 domain-containing protein n=1 Tax=Rhodopila sp. TaxID=2480087 RepID=UPI002CAD3BB4|nr:DUF3576 domain-containing protein [Rhodopila sp.]HVY14415.1 DUF3576 domain-containing protein [Rhodopila sp.]